MNILRKFFISSCASLLSLSILVGVTLVSINGAFNKPDNLKQWLRDSKAYDTFVPALLEQATKPSNTDQPGGEVNSFTRPEVQTAFKQAFTPTFVQQSTENALDGTYGWLQGKTPKPVYNIDLSAPKAAFANSVATSARTRLASLPPCTPQNIPATSDPFELSCQPPASLSDPEIQKLVDQIKNGGDFLPQNAITADTTNIGGEQTQSPGRPGISTPQPWYQQFSQAPTLFQWAQIGPWLLGGAALLLGLLIVFVAQTKRSGLRVIASTSIGAGALITASAAFTLIFLAKFAQPVPSDAGALQQPLMYIVKTAAVTVGKTQLWWGIGIMLAGIMGLVALYFTGSKHDPTAKPDNEDRHDTLPAPVSMPSPDAPDAKPIDPTKPVH